jgi:hypothetical protein
MKLHRRYLGQINYAASATRTLPIPRNYALVALDVHLICKLSREAGSEGAPKDCAPAQLIKNLTVKANGSDTIKSLDMETLHRHNEITYGVRPFISADAWLGFGAKTNEVLEVTARIPFAMPRAIKQIDTLLDTPAMSSLDLIVTFGVGLDTMNDTFDGASVTVTDCVVHVTAVEYLGVAAGSKFMIYNQWVKQKEVTATTNRFQVKLPVGNVYRGFLIKAHSDGDQVNTILPWSLTALNEIKLQSGTEVYLAMLAGILQAQNRLTQQIQVPELITDAAAVNHSLLENGLLGYYYIDFCRDGRLSEALDTRVLSDLEFMLGVASVGTADFIEVYADELMLPAIAG